MIPVRRQVENRRADQLKLVVPALVQRRQLLWCGRVRRAGHRIAGVDELPTTAILLETAHHGNRVDLLDGLLLPGLSGQVRQNRNDENSS